MKVNKLLALILALVLVVGMFAGCTPNEVVEDTPTLPVEEETPEVEETPEALGEPIKIGHIVDLTGVESTIGKTAVQSFDFAIEYIGGKIGNRPIEVITEDARSDSAAAADVARKLVEQDGVDIIFGPTQVGHKRSVGEYMAGAENPIPVVFYNPTPPMMLANGNPWVVASGGVNPQMPTVMAAYVYNELGYETVYTIAKDDTGGRGYIEPFKATFEALGGKIIDEVYAPVESTDFQAVLGTFDASKADGIVAWCSGGEAIALWSAWYEMGLSESLPMVGASHGGFSDSFIVQALFGKNPDMAAAMMECVRAPICYGVTADTPENKAFVAAWEAEFGVIPLGSNLPGACAQALLLLQAAVEATGGDTSSEALRDALLAADVKGPEGHTLFGDGQVATKDIFIVKVIQLEDGTYNYETVKIYEDVPPAGYKVG